MDSTPTREGFYWGRWRRPAPGTADDGDACGGTIWEVHDVWWADWSETQLLVSVPGVEKAQPLDAFEWGEEVPRPAYAQPRF